MSKNWLADVLCHRSSILRGTGVTPFTFFLFNRQRGWMEKLSDFLQINGTVRCGNVLVTVTTRIPLGKSGSIREMIEEHFCRPSLSVISSLVLVHSRPSCHLANQFSDVWNKWNQCFSVTRIRDGEKNNLNGRDEEEQSDMEMEKTCARVRRHRLPCSREEPSCLSVIQLADRHSDCLNRFDELFFGVDRTIPLVRCDNQRQD